MCNLVSVSLVSVTVVIAFDVIETDTVVVYAGKAIDFTELLPLADEEIQSHLSKYWSQRYRLFLKYDSGIKMDRGQWYNC